MATPFGLTRQRPMAGPNTTGVTYDDGAQLSVLGGSRIVDQPDVMARALITWGDDTGDEDLFR
ncbi:MAG: hypothetical protein JWL97_4285 [Gemmatimonadales bacterium]|jgi:hypothetical protein|nr:hypothetical protein [Gemmatimonadales bacterium]